MFPDQRTSYARWVFERPETPERQGRPGYFKFSDQNHEASAEGVSLAWREYCWFLFLRNSVDDGRITTGLMEGAERYGPEKGAMPMPREEVMRQVARPRRAIPFVRPKPVSVKHDEVSVPRD